MSAGVRVAAFLLLAALLPAGGCNFAPLALLLGPRQIQKAEVKLTNGRLLILAETARPDQENPVFLGALHDKLVEILRTNKVPSQIVPPAELARLRQENPDFGRWSVARIEHAFVHLQIHRHRRGDFGIPYVAGRGGDLRLRRRRCCIRRRHEFGVG